MKQIKMLPLPFGYHVWASVPGVYFLLLQLRESSPLALLCSFVSFVPVRGAAGG